VNSIADASQAPKAATAAAAVPTIMPVKAETLAIVDMLRSYFWLKHIKTQY
jgi:hypothetical protein